MECSNMVLEMLFNHETDEKYEKEGVMKTVGAI
jgi:hypothetical protein